MIKRQSRRIPPLWWSDSGSPRESSATAAPTVGRPLWSSSPFLLSSLSLSLYLSLILTSLLVVFFFFTCVYLKCCTVLQNIAKIGYWQGPTRTRYSPATRYFCNTRFGSVFKIWLLKISGNIRYFGYTRYLGKPEHWVYLSTQNTQIYLEIPNSKKGTQTNPVIYFNTSTRPEPARYKTFF